MTQFDINNNDSYFVSDCVNVFNDESTGYTTAKQACQNCSYRDDCSPFTDEGASVGVCASLIPGFAPPPCTPGGGMSPNSNNSNSNNSNSMSSSSNGNSLSSPSIPVQTTFVPPPHHKNKFSKKQLILMIGGVVCALLVVIVLVYMSMSHK